MSEGNEIVKQESSALSPMNLIELAISTNADIDKLEKLMQLKERWDKEQARKSFINSMSLFQSELPVIKRTKAGSKTKSGEVAYHYAPLDSIVEQTRLLISKHGFSYTLDTPVSLEDGVEIKITVSHIDGHSETTTVKMPFVERTGVMSPPQVLGATMSYAKRYAFCNAFGIMTGDDDSDAITPSLTESFEEITKDWQHKDKYINLVVSQIESKRAFSQFLISLPTQPHTEQFINILQHVDTNLHEKLWIDYQKQNSGSVDAWLKSLKQSKIYKGDKNGN